MSLCRSAFAGPVRPWLARALSTPAPQSPPPAKPPKRDDLDLSFADPRAAFKSKTMFELFRAYFVFQMCSVNFIVENNAQIMKLCRGVLGERLFEYVMKLTFYGHFVAGEDRYKIVPTLQRLSSFGVKPLLDYSVEEDISQEEAEKLEVSKNEQRDPTEAALTPNGPTCRDVNQYGDIYVSSSRSTDGDKMGHIIYL